MKIPFPIAVDNTILSTFRTCERLGFYQYLQHYKPRNESVHLIAGGAFASGLETLRRAYFIDQKSEEESLELAFLSLTKGYSHHDFTDHKKSWENTVRALLYYVDKFPLATEKYKPFLYGGRSTIEYSFIIPLEVNHPVTGEPLLYTGRADQIVQDLHGILYLEDDKTTSQLGQSFADKWELRSQFTGYQFAANRFAGMDVRGTLVRGICFYAGGRIDSQEVITYRSDKELDEWWEVTNETARRLIRSWETGFSLMNLGDACESYGGCSFKSICKSKDPEKWLPVDFERKIWDPVLREVVPYIEEN